MKNKQLIIACLSGTIIEWFDFSLLGVLSSVLATLFFPNDSPSVSLLKTFSIFALGFFIRPIGAIFWGHLGDKIGRKRVLVSTIILMTASTALIGLLPTYIEIGILSPLLLTFLRLTQGFSASGEQAGVLTYLYETAPEGKKKLLSSISMVGIYTGMCLSTLFGLLIHLFLNKQELLNWGWRIPFISSIALGYLGYSLRIKMLESESFKNYLSSKKMISASEWLNTLIKSKRKILRGIGVFQLAIIIPYITFVYMASYLIKLNIFSNTFVYLITFMNLLITATSVAFFANIAEKTKLNLRLISIVGLLMGGLLIFSWFFQRNIILFGVAQAYFGIFTALLVGPFCSELANCFPTNIRCTSVAVCLNFTAAIFGGLTPLIMSSLQLTNRPMTYSIMFISLSCYIALLCKKSTKEEIVDDRILQ